MEDRSIGRNKKILSTINNEKFIAMNSRALTNFQIFWKYVDHKPIINSRKELREILKILNYLKKFQKNERIGV